MLKIDEEKLKSLLEKKKTKIGFQKTNIIPPVISAVSSLITFLCKDVFPNKFIKGLMLTVVFVSFIYAIYILIQNIVHNYSYNMLYYDIESLDDNKVHVFNIVVQKYNDKSGKFLLFYQPSWKCKLFPNYKSVCKYKKGDVPFADDLKNICKLYQSDTGIKISEKQLQYKGEIDDFKYSVNDKINKHYVFRFFLVISQPTDNLSDSSFKYGGKTYYWMTIQDMLKDRNILKKNKKVVDYVRAFTTSS